MEPAVARVVIACPGLGVSARGFERFARDCFTALSGRDDVDAFLLKGAGPPGPRERAVPTLPRTHPLARGGARAEQLSFAAGAVPALLRLRPHVVVVSEWALATALAKLRGATGRRFRILLCNGAAGPPPFPAGVDHVQHPVPSLHERALAAGEPPSRHTQLPLGVAIPREWSPPGPQERRALRERLGLPADARVLLSVGALDATGKRMDLLVDEVAAMGHGRPYLVMVGEREAETPWLLRRAAEALGPGGFAARTVAPEEVGAYYRAADVFALASMSEGFGLTMVEAMANGLPVVAHDYEVPRYVLGRHGALGDLLVRGTLARLVAGAGGLDPARHRSAYERYSWDGLAGRYAEMVRRCAA